jgi:hypothetical protein
MAIQPLIGPNGSIPIIIRDDDINFFTSTNMLESVHYKTWEKGFKVSLSVVPFQKGIDDVCVPPDVRNTGLYYCIANNEKLIEYLKSKIESRSTEILQHGYSHSIVNGRGEFGGSNVIRSSGGIPSTNCSDNIGSYGHNHPRKVSSGHNIPNVNYNDKTVAIIESGRNMLTQAFNVRPRFFVPPYDDISKRNLNLISHNLRMVPIYGQTVLHKFFNSSTVPNLIKNFVGVILSKKYTKSAFILPLIVDPAKNFIHNKNNKISIASSSSSASSSCPSIILSLPSIEVARLLLKDYFGRQAASTTATALTNTIGRLTSSQVRIRLPICILNHYHHYFYDWEKSITRKDLFKAWEKLLDSLNNLNYAWKVDFSELYERLRKVQQVNISETGSKITLEFTSNDSTEYIDNFSFAVSYRLEKSDSHVITQQKYNEERINIVTINERLLPKSKIVFYKKEC